jgi:hypothetical protein
MKEECFDMLVVNYKNICETTDYKELSDELRSEIETYVHQKPVYLAAKQQGKVQKKGQEEKAVL